MGRKKQEEEQNNPEYGEPAQFDPTFTGPIHNRSCTDIICCVLFMVVIAGYMVVGILGKFLFISLFLCLSVCDYIYGLECAQILYCYIVCVKTCPSEFWILPPSAHFPGAKPADFFKQEYCVPSLQLKDTIYVTMDIVNKELCPLFYMPTTSVLGRCFGLVIAMVVSVLFLLLLRFTAPVLVWVLIIGVLAVGAFGIWYCYNEYMSLVSSSLTFSNVGFTSNVQVYLQVRDTWLAFLIILCVVEAILLLALIFLRTRILIAIALIQETSKALGHMMSTLIYPIVTFVLLLVCVSYWGITALYLATSGAPVYKVVAMNTSQGDCSVIRVNETCDPEMFNSTQYPSCPSARCIFINYNEEGLFQRNLFNLQIYNVVAFLWCVNFVIALGHCTLAGAFGSYYWAFSKPADIPTFPLIQSFMRALRYHVGSLAFCVVLFRFVSCFFVLFCFVLLRSKSLTDLLLFFGKLLVVGGVGVLAFFFFSGRIQTPGTTFETAALNYYWMPIMTVVFGAYLIAHGFFSVYNMGVDTLFLCFLEDLERNDGSPQKPYFMSKNLMKILNKKNKAPKTG
uniref:Choline transporter-like protein n=1 Tax=Sinocyclocheilus grahami TaxID=75366 RepID=A0A672T4A1_SINGR